MDSGTQDTVAFTRMADGTRADYQLLDRKYQAVVSRFPDEAMAMLKRLGGDKLGYKIDRFQHSLQSATRAFRDGADEETVVCALLHDVGDILAPDNHSDLAAAILQPYVSEKNHWIIRHHGIFQGYYYFHHIGGDRDERERYRGHQWFEACADFCERWDQNSFDPDYDTMPLEAFEPMVRRILGRKAFAWQA